MDDFVTVSPVNKIDINTAPSEVLQSIGISAGMAGMIVEKRNKEPFINLVDMNAFLGPESTMAASQLAITSDVFTVDSYATVGGYTKQIEAVITRTASGCTINYWRAL